MSVGWAAEAAAESTAGGGYWQLAMVLGAIGFLGLFARWRKARMPVAPIGRDIRERDENPNRHRDAADRAIVELLETSRVLNAQVDTKIRMLNRLVKDAEEHMAGLEALLAEARAIRDGEKPPPRPAAKPAPEPEDKPASAAPAVPAREFMSDLHERIHRLREEGKSVAEIAKTTNLSTTEVEFIVKTL